MAKSDLEKDRLIRLHNEILLAEKRTENELVPQLQRNLARYTGDFVPEFAVDWDILLNEVYPIIQHNIPSIFFRNPRVFIKPKNKNFIAKRRNLESGEIEEVSLDSTKAARTQEAILNYVLEEINYKKEIRKVLLDSLIAPFGCLWHGYKGEFGMTNEQSMFIKNEMVFVRRISPQRFLWDPAVNLANLDEARWIARSFDVPMEDVLDDDDLNVNKDIVKGFQGFGETIKENISAFVKKGGQDKVSSHNRLKPLIDFAQSEYKNSKMSRFITLYEMFVRPTKKELKNKEKGKVVLLTKEQFEELRINPWNYKAEGYPAKILEFNSLNDDIYGLDDISTYESIIDNKNIIRNIQLRNAQESSKVWVALAKDGTNEEDIEKIKVGDQTIILFDGESVQGKMQVSSPGIGASGELYIVDQRIDRELQDKSGVNDLKRGFLQSGEESAASVQIRASGSAIRQQYRQDIMADFLKESVDFVNQLLKQFMPVKSAVRIVGSLDLEWSEEPTKEEIQAPTDVELDVISMLPENPEKEANNLQGILNLMNAAVTNPAIFQKIQTEGNTFNLSPIIEQLLLRLRIRDPEAFRKIRSEESQGFVSVQELRNAQANVESVLQGQPPPDPPAIGQDHRARLELYGSIAKLLEAAGNPNQQLMGLIQQQLIFLQDEERKTAPRQGQAVGA